MNQVARRFLTGLFHRHQAGIASVTGFHTAAEAGVAMAWPAIHAELLTAMRDLLPQVLGGAQYMDAESCAAEASITAERAANKTIEDALAAVDAAAMVFEHSIIDSVAFDLIRVIGYVSPEDFRAVIGKRSVTMTLDELAQLSPEATYGKVLKQYLAEAGRKSLPEKVQLLYQYCKPNGNFVSLKGYRYDAGRLKRLDTLRHGIVHGTEPRSRIPNLQAELWWLNRTAHHLLMLVGDRYGTRIGFPIFDLKLMGDLSLGNVKLSELDLPDPEGAPTRGRPPSPAPHHAHVE